MARVPEAVVVGLSAAAVTLAVRFIDVFEKRRESATRSHHELDDLTVQERRLLSADEQTIRAELRQTIADLRRENADLLRRIAALEARVRVLEG